MKKKLISVKDFADKMDAIKRKIKNAFSEEGAEADRKSTRLNSSHAKTSRMPSSA